jgi:hypothetical protein
MRGSALDADRVRRALRRLPAPKRAIAVEGLALLARACRALQRSRTS